MNLGDFRGDHVSFFILCVQERDSIVRQTNKSLSEIDFTIMFEACRATCLRIVHPYVHILKELFKICTEWVIQKIHSLPTGTDD